MSTYNIREYLGNTFDKYLIKNFNIERTRWRQYFEITDEVRVLYDELWEKGSFINFVTENIYASIAA